MEVGSWVAIVSSTAGGSCQTGTQGRNRPAKLLANGLKRASARHALLAGAEAGERWGEENRSTASVWHTPASRRAGFPP